MKKFLLLIMLLIPAIGYADKCPKDFIQGVTDKVIGIVADENLDSEQKEEELNQVFIDVVDVDWIGKFVLGKYWRRATDEQKKEYLEAYRLFLQKTYVSNFKKYDGEKVKIKKTRKEDEGEYLVETTIERGNGKTLDVDYKVRNTEGGKKIFDIYIEGVSLLNTQRTEFNSVVSRNGLDNFIKKMKYRVKNL